MRSSSRGLALRSSICALKKPRMLLRASRRTYGIGEAGLEHAAHPAGERVAHVGGHAQHGGDDAHRDLLGVVGGGIGLAPLDEAVDETVAQLAGAVLELGHGLRGEERQDEPAVPVVLGRIAA